MGNRPLGLVKKHAIGIILALFALLLFSDVSFFHQQKQQQVINKECFLNKETQNTSNIPKLSEIVGPRIDEEAASISCKKIAYNVEASSCQTLPVKIWLLLLICYLFLLVFNLSYDFNETVNPRSLWEIILTGVFIFGWLYFDKCGVNIWFPLGIIKFGIVIYLSYLYFFEKKGKN